MHASGFTVILPSPPFWMGLFDCFILFHIICIWLLFNSLALVVIVVFLFYFVFFAHVGFALHFSALS